MDLKTWYLEREIDKLKEEVYYWRSHYNQTMNFFLLATAQRHRAERQLKELRLRNRKNKRRK